MERQDSQTTRLDEYLVNMLPWAHGHQRKAIRAFVQAIIARQTGCQAQLARHFGKQEAAAKRLARLWHNERLEPRHLAAAVLLQALGHLPVHDPVRLAIDWTSEGEQYLLVVSLIVGRRAVPIYWRAYAAAEYGRRPGCEAGFRDAKWWLGCAQARIKQITAWSPPVCLVCHRAAGRGESGDPLVAAGRPAGVHIAASSRLAPLRPL